MSLPVDIDLKKILLTFFISWTTVEIHISCSPLSTCMTSHASSGTLFHFATTSVTLKLFFVLFLAYVFFCVWILYVTVCQVFSPLKMHCCCLTVLVYQAFSSKNFLLAAFFLIDVTLKVQLQDGLRLIPLSKLHSYNL